MTQTTKMQDTTVLGYKKYFYDNNGNVTKEVAGLANFVVPQAVSARVADIYNSPEKTYDIVNSEIKDKVVAKTVTTLISSSIAADNTQFNEKIVQYNYDSFNQLTEAKNDAGTILKNTYNGEGLRVSKEQGAQKTNLLYEGNQVVLEVDGATGTEKARNVYGNNLISRKSGTTTAYYMYNGHGDVTNLLDGKGGIIGSYYYDAFGNVQENTSSFSNPYRYAGYQYDEEIGKYYLLNRMYDPESARFMQEDTYRGNANDPLSLNLYTYVNNNPMIYDDQNGHWPSFVDNFFSSAKSVLSSAVSYVKNIYNDVINLPSTISSGFNYVKDTVYSWGKTINSTYKTIKTVYNKVVKPVVTNYAKQKIEEVKTGISVKAGEVANYVKNIDVPKLLFGGMSVVAGAGAIATGIGIGLVPGLQLVGIGLIGAGAASIVYGGAEVAESTMHVNPIKDFAEQSLGMSETAYDITGMAVSTVSSAGTEAFAGIAKLGWSALRSKFSEGKIAQAIRTGAMFEIAKGGVAGDNKGSFLKGITNLENDIISKTKGVPEPGDMDFIGPLTKTDHHFIMGEGIGPKQRGVLGAHNEHFFNSTLESTGFSLDELKIGERIPHPTIDGVYAQKYTVPSYNGRGEFIGFKNIKEPKTVFDPNKISGSQMLKWGKQAMANGTINGRIIEGTASNGLQFRGYIENGEVASFFPVVPN